MQINEMPKNAQIIIASQTLRGMYAVAAADAATRQGRVIEKSCAASPRGLAPSVALPIRRGSRKPNGVGHNAATAPSASGRAMSKRTFARTAPTPKVEATEPQPQIMGTGINVHNLSRAVLVFAEAENPGVGLLAAFLEFRKTARRGGRRNVGRVDESGGVEVRSGGEEEHGAKHRPFGGGDVFGFSLDAGAGGDLFARPVFEARGEVFAPSRREARHAVIQTLPHTSNFNVLYGEDAKMPLVFYRTFKLQPINDIHINTQSVNTNLIIKPFLRHVYSLFNFNS